MSLFRRNKTDRPTPKPTVPEFAFCERSTATPTSPIHIRRVGEEGLKLGGGIPALPLCGSDLWHGWDLSGPVTPDAVRVQSTPRPGDGRVFLCSGCTAAYNTLPDR